MDVESKKHFKHHGWSIMLVLSRKRNEVIAVGNNIRITVLGIKGDTVKFGIEAPLTVPVHRSEIHGRIFEEQIPVELN